MRRAIPFPLRTGPSDSLFQSTLSMRRAILEVLRLADGDIISIHALHEESDFDAPVGWLRGLISIHALHEESDLF